MCQDSDSSQAPEPWNAWDFLVATLFFVRSLNKATTKALTSFISGAQSRSSAVDAKRKFAREAGFEIERITGERE